MLTDWLMVIITFIYVIATIFICVFNGKSATAAKEQTNEMIKQYNSMNRPFVSIRFDIVRSGLLCFIIENEGPLPAKDVNIKINKEFIENIVDDNNRNRLLELNKAHMYLASKQKITVLLAGQNSFSQIAKEIAKFDISYNEFNEHTEIDLNQYKFLLVYQSPLEDISQHIRKIKDNEKKFQNDVIKSLNKSPQIQNVVIHNETEDDSNKFKLFKEICIFPNSNATELANKTGLDKGYVFELLNELESVDCLIYHTFYEIPENDENALWHRRR